MNAGSRANILELAAAILLQAARQLEDPGIVGGPMLGAAQDCRMLAKWKKGEAKKLRQEAAAERIRQKAKST